MKFRSSHIIELARDQLSADDYDALAFILARFDTASKELAALAAQHYTSEEQLLDALRVSIRKFQNTTEYADTRHVRKLLRSVPPGERFEVSADVLRKLDQLAKKFEVSRDALMRAILECFAMIPDVASGALRQNQALIPR